MRTDQETAAETETEKKPYEAPKLVVMGTAREMTQIGIPAEDFDGTFSADPAPS